MRSTPTLASLCAPASRLAAPTRSWTDETADRGGILPRDDTLSWLGWYAISILGSVVCVMASSAVVAEARIAGGRSMHRGLLRTIMRAPTSFFDTTPLGRLTNRFSKECVA